MLSLNAIRSWVLAHRLWVLLAVVLTVVLGVWLNQPPKAFVYSAQVQALEVQNGSRVGGRVAAILVEEGQRVTQGQALVRFQDEELQTRLQDAKAALNETKARKSLLQSSIAPSDLQVAQSNVDQAQQKVQLLSKDTHQADTMAAMASVDEADLKIDTASKQYQQAKKSFESGIISSQRLEEARLQLKGAETNKKVALSKLKAVQEAVQPEEISIAQAKLRSAQAEYGKLKGGVKPSEIAIADAKIQQAESALKSLEVKQHESIVKAPMDGTVNLIAVTMGQLVPPDAPVVTLLDEQHLWVDVYIPESTLPYVQSGQTVVVDAPVFKKYRFEGKVAFVSTKSEFIPGSGSGSSTSSTETSFRVKVLLNADPTAKRGRFKGGLSNAPAPHLSPGMSVNVLFPLP